MAVVKNQLGKVRDGLKTILALTRVFLGRGNNSQATLFKTKPPHHSSTSVTSLPTAHKEDSLSVAEKKGKA